MSILNELPEFKAIAEAATPGNWWTGVHRCESVEDAEKYLARMFNYYPERLDLNMAYVAETWTEEVTEIATIPALTGNGPNAENNARFIAAFNPKNALALINEIEHLKSVIQKSISWAEFTDEQLEELATDLRRVTPPGYPG